MRRSRSRADVARSLRVELPDKLVDDEFILRLASLAAISPAVPGRTVGVRRRIAALTIALVALVAGSGLGVAFGAGLVDAPWSIDPGPPVRTRIESPSPSSVEDSPPTPATPPEATSDGSGNSGQDPSRKGQQAQQDEPGEKASAKPDPGDEDADHATEAAQKAKEADKAAEKAQKQAQKKADKADHKADHKANDTAEKAPKVEHGNDGKPKRIG